MPRSYFIILCLSIFILSCSKEETTLIIHECSCIVETAQDTYIYPIRPGSDEWDSITTSDGFADATQISFNDLNKMSTTGLIETCLENPNFFDLYLSETPQLFYNNFSHLFNVCKVLVKRDDAMEKLIERYSSMCVRCAENNYSSYSGKGGEIMYAFDQIELLMAQNDFLSKISRSNRLELAKKVLEKYEEKLNINTSLYHQNTSVWLAGRIMNYDSFPEMRKLMENHFEIDFLITHGIIIVPANDSINTGEIHSMVISTLKNYLKQKK